jgi:hypothetical protein
MGFCRFLVSGSKYLAIAHVAQLAERVLGKDEVISSILIMGSRTINYKRTAIDITTPGDSNG